MGKVLRHPKAALCAAHIANETICVSRALGIAMEPVAGQDFTGLAFKNKGGVGCGVCLAPNLLGPLGGPETQHAAGSGEGQEM